MKIRNLITAAFACMISTSALADDLLDRLEAATEAIGANQGKFYVSRVPDLADKLPDWEWDDEIRMASKCVLDGIESAKGRTVAEAYVTGLEGQANKEITSMAQLNDQSFVPAELSGDDTTILTLMQSCRTMDISAERLKASGFWDAIMDPTVMQALTAE